MKMVKVKGIDLLKVYTFVSSQKKQRKRSCYFFKIIKDWPEQDYEFLCYYNERSFFVAEDRKTFIMLHGEYEHENDFRECMARINKKSIIRIQENVDGSIPLLAFHKHHVPATVGYKNEFTYDLRVKEAESILGKVEGSSFWVGNGVAQAIHKKNYFARRNEKGDISYLQFYSIDQRTYYGNFLWSNLKGVDVIKNFIQSSYLVDDIDSFQTHISALNRSSIALHEICGYVRDSIRDYYSVEHRC